MKVERFITEYANHQKRAYAANELMNPGIRNELIRRIDQAIMYRSKGMITVDEAMGIIGEYYSKDEDMTQYMTA